MYSIPVGLYYTSVITRGVATAKFLIQVLSLIFDPICLGLWVLFNPSFEFYFFYFVIFRPVVLPQGECFICFDM